MSGEIINKVANSPLKTIDLGDFHPPERRVLIDLKQWLFQEAIIIEKDFRAQLKNYDFLAYKNCYVAIHCSVETILPSWAFMLVASHLTGIAKKVVFGNLIMLENQIYSDLIAQISIEEYINKPVIIKGCSSIKIPENAYILLMQRLQPIAKSIFYGEACSSVPLFKTQKNKSS